MPHLKWSPQKIKEKLCQTGIESGEGRGYGAVMMMGPKWAVGKWLRGNQLNLLAICICCCICCCICLHTKAEDLAVGKWIVGRQGREQSNGGRGKGRKIGGQ